MRISLTLLFLGMSAAHDMHPGPWSLPPVAKQRNKNRDSFINECESLVAFLQRFRGGTSYGNSDDWSQPNYEKPTNYGGYDDEKDYYASSRRQPDDRYNDYYDDYGRSSERKSGPSGSSISSIIKNGDRKIGITLLSFGVAITFLGFSMFFNKMLLRLGNLLLIAGVPMTVGPSRTMGYFVKPEKFRATGCLALGIFSSLSDAQSLVLSWKYLDC